MKARNNSGSTLSILIKQYAAKKGLPENSSPLFVMNLAATVVLNSEGRRRSKKCFKPKMLNEVVFKELSSFTLTLLPENREARSRSNSDSQLKVSSSATLRNRSLSLGGEAECAKSAVDGSSDKSCKTTDFFMLTHYKYQRYYPEFNIALKKLSTVIAKMSSVEFMQFILKNISCMVNPR